MDFYARSHSYHSMHYALLQDLAVVPLLSSDSDSDLDSDALCSDSEPRTTCSVSSKIHAKCNKVSSCR